MKRSGIILVMLSIALLLSSIQPTSTQASTAIRAFLNGAEISFDQRPLILEGSTVVPLRAIFTALEATVTWNANTKKVSATRGNVNIELTIGQSIALRNGQQIKLTQPAAIINGFTYVPLRFVSESLGASVEWLASTRTIQIFDTSVYARNPLTASQIYQLANAAVAYVECYGANNQLIASGSGFMTSADGLFVTNYHVITNEQLPIQYVNIKFGDGKIYTRVVDVLNFDATNDTAVLKIPNVSNRPFLKIGDFNATLTGDTVYAIGSPLGLENTISQGIISTKRRVVDSVEFIQISVPIDSGSSGGALLNSYGEVVGITTAKIESTANLNLAVPITIYSRLNLTGNKTTIGAMNGLNANSGSSVVATLITGEMTYVEQEPNDTDAIAEPLNYTRNYIYGSIGDSTDIDQFQFTLTRSSKVTVIGYLTGNDNYLNDYFIFGILNRSGDVLARTASTNSFTSTSKPIVDYYSFNVQLSPGTYRLVAVSDDERSYSFDLLPRDYNFLLTIE